MLKFLMVLNLAIVVLMILVKIKKSKICQGHFFSNMVKIKLFIADIESYVPLELNKLASNVHLFKLTGALPLDNVTLKKNWIWGVLEVNWNDVHITLNDKEINLPMSIVIPIAYKLKVRKLFRKKERIIAFICNVKAKKIMVFLCPTARAAGARLVPVWSGASDVCRRHGECGMVCDYACWCHNARVHRTIHWLKGSASWCGG